MINIKHPRIIFTAIFLIELCCFQAMAISSRNKIISEVNVSTGEVYSLIRVSFDFPVQYLRHVPPNFGQEVRIRLRPIIASREDQEGLSRNESHDPPAKNPAGVVRVDYEGRDSSEPTLTVFFDKPRQFEIKQGEDFRSIVIQVPVEKTKESVELSQEELKSKKTSLSRKDFTKSVPLSLERQESLLKEGSDAMAQNNYMRAVQVYTKLLESTDPAIQESVQFQLASAQEYAGHLALAKAEYKNYMNTYPKGPSFTQAEERYKALMADDPTRADDSKETAGIWKSEFYGSISEFYYRDSSFVQDEKNEEGLQEETNVSSLTTEIDATWRLKNDKYQLETLAIGSFEGDLSGDDENEIRSSALYVDFKDLDKTLTTRWGRQTGNSGGVLGRFDGGRFSYLLTEKVRLNLVTGFPVNQSSDDLQSDKLFYGINFDFGRFAEHWLFNSYFINQTADGIEDRRAVGTELRYIDKRGSFFSLLDYDILFNELSIFIFTGNWLLPNDSTRMILSIDYRGNPILSTSNASIGQLSPSLEELEASIGKNALQKLADDRTLNSRFASLGISHTLTEDLQISGDVSWSKLDGSPASGGIDEITSTGDEFYYSTQIINNNFFRDGDISTLGLRYADTKQRDTYSLTLSSRQPINDKWRITPRLQVDYRDNKLQEGEQWRFRPGLRAEYFFTKTWRFEFEGQYSIADEELPGVAEDKSGYLLSIGLRWSF